MTDLNVEFQAATSAVKGLRQRPGNKTLLALYGFYKQATAGDVGGVRPTGFDLEGKAKYDAWAARKGMQRDDAMREYIALANDLIASQR
jgi:carboxylesterase